MKHNPWIGYAFYRKHCERCGSLIAGSTQAAWDDHMVKHNQERHGQNSMFLDLTIPDPVRARETGETDG